MWNAYELFVAGTVSAILLNQLIVIGGVAYGAYMVADMLENADGLMMIQELFMDWWGGTDDHTRESWQAFAERWGQRIQSTHDWIRWAYDMWSEEWLSPEEQEWWDKEWAFGATEGWGTPGDLWEWGWRR